MKVDAGIPAVERLNGESSLRAPPCLAPSLCSPVPRSRNLSYTPNKCCRLYPEYRVRRVRRPVQAPAPQITAHLRNPGNHSSDNGLVIAVLFLQRCAPIRVQWRRYFSSQTVRSVRGWHEPEIAQLQSLRRWPAGYRGLGEGL